MTETTEMQSTALVTLDPVQYVAETFAPYREQLHLAKSDFARVNLDVTTKQGYEKSKEIWRVYKGMRIKVEETRKLRKDPIIQIGKLIDKEHGALESEILAEEEFYQQQWKAEDARQEAIKAEQIRIEQERKSAIESALSSLVNAPTNAISMTAARVASLLDEVRATEITEVVFGDRTVEAENAKFKAIDALQQLHIAKVAQETQAKIEADRAAAEAANKAEENRKSNIKTKILLIENAIAQAAMLEASAEVQAIIDKVTYTAIDDSFAEFKDEAEGVKARVLKALSRTLNMVKAEEAQAIIDARAEAQPINGAKPEVAQSEATPSRQDQVSEKQSSPAPTELEQALKQTFATTKEKPNREQIVSLVADHYGVSHHQARGWLNDLFYVMAA